MRADAVLSRGNPLKKHAKFIFHSNSRGYMRATTIPHRLKFNSLSACASSWPPSIHRGKSINRPRARAGRAYFPRHLSQHDNALNQSSARVARPFVKIGQSISSPSPSLSLCHEVNQLVFRERYENTFGPFIRPAPPRNKRPSIFRTRTWEARNFYISLEM